MKKRICESLEAKLVATQSSIQLDNMFNMWSCCKYGALSIALANLRALNMIHHQHHWVTSGQNAYQDHLLFQRLYEAIDDEFDSLGERCVGLDTTKTVDLTLQLKTIYLFVQDNITNNMTMTYNNDLVQKSLNAELMFLNVINKVREQLTMNSLLTSGLDDLLAGIEDTHETHVYLLKQRLGQ